MTQDAEQVALDAHVAALDAALVGTPVMEQIDALARTLSHGDESLYRDLRSFGVRLVDIGMKIGRRP